MGNDRGKKLLPDNLPAVIVRFSGESKYPPRIVGENECNYCHVKCVCLLRLYIAVSLVIELLQKVKTRKQAETNPYTCCTYFMTRTNSKHFCVF